MEPVQAPGPAPAAPAKAAGPSVAPVLPADAPGTGAVPVPGVAVSAPAPPEEDAVPASSDMVSDAIPDASPGVIPDAVDGANAADAADAAGVLDAVDTADAADMVDVADASVVRAPEPRVESDAGVGEEKVAEPVSEPAPEPVAVREAALFVDPFAGLDDVASLDLYDLSNYTFGKKDVESSGQSMCAVPSAEMSAKLEKRYKERGMRRSVAAVVLVHSHRFPHILLLQRSDGTGKYELPGGRLRPGENDDEGLQRKLKAKLTPIAAAPAAAEEDQELEIGERSRFLLFCYLKYTYCLPSPCLPHSLRVYKRCACSRRLFILYPNSLWAASLAGNLPSLTKT